MKIKRTFREQLEANKKLVLILMIAVIVIGIIRLFYVRSLSANKKTENLEESAFVEIKESVLSGSGVGIIDALDIYSEIKDLDVTDSLKIKKMNDKLDKIIDK